MKKEENITEKQDGVFISGPTKKCPNCGEDLPEKISFCLYCMEQLNGAAKPEAKVETQNSDLHSLKDKSKKVFVGVVVLVLVVFGVTITYLAGRQDMLDDSPPANNTQSDSQTTSAISLEQAIEIGYEELARQGYTGTFSTHSGLDREHGQLVWELLFRVDGGSAPLVEIYINADDGNIVKFEWDD